MFIKVRVKTGAKNESIIKKNKDTYIVSVKEPAERNLANNRICIIMANQFKTKISNIRIINGHHNQSKILSINLPSNDII